MKTSDRRRRESFAFPLQAWPKDQVCFSILLQFPCPTVGAISREDLAAAVRSLGFMPPGSRLGITLVVGSVADLIEVAVARRLREAEEQQATVLQRLPPPKPVVTNAEDELDEAANG